MGLLMKYFVLKPGGGSPYAVASRAAMRAYAVAIREVDLELANELENWVVREEEQVMARAVAGRAKHLPERVTQPTSAPMLVADALELVDTDRRFTMDEIRGWSDTTREEVFEWAMSVHLAASDNDVEVPPMPAVLKVPR